MLRQTMATGKQTNDPPIVPLDPRRHMIAAHVLVPLHDHITIINGTKHVQTIIVS